MHNETIDAISRGWRVFLLEPRSKKQPLIKRWPELATTDKDTIQKWLSECPNANIAIATGEESGIFVFDVDVKGKGGKKKGAESLAELEAEHGKLPKTYEVTTGTNGRHLYFAYPTGRNLRNRTNFLPGLDIRANGGYVVAPPSIHPDTGKTYDVVTHEVMRKQPNAAPWASPHPSQEPIDVVPAPEWLLEIIDPPQVAYIPPPVRTPQSASQTPVMERASLYLKKVPSATQGAGGHNALMNAARCLVHGFELSDSEALSLLWNEYNPRCSPPWNPSIPKEVHDFERKVSEVRRVPFDKPRGWLLNECGLRSETDVMASIIGANFAKSFEERENNVETAEEITEEMPVSDFPLHCFPDKVREYIEMLADVQVVNPSGVALSVIVAAGGAMGNAFRLRLKGGYDVPPILWGAILSRSGSNKSGPFREIIKPLREMVPFAGLENEIRNPQGQMLIEDATTEAVLGVMANSHRGLLLANGEGAGWVGAFDRYSQGSKKKVSVDETIWLKMWDCDAYQRNRKTDKENTLIHSAACGVLVCIQPKKMAECFDPTQFASGLVPRLLVVYLPKECRLWSEREMNTEDVMWWRDTVMRLRSYPFANMNPNTQEFIPNIIKLTPEAKAIYVEEFNRIAKEIKTADDMSELFLGKSQGMTGRIALVLHGLEAVCGLHDIADDLSDQTMLYAIEVMQYLVQQQLDIYQLAGKSYEQKRLTEALAVARSKKFLTTRTLQRSNSKRWKYAKDAKQDIDLLVNAGYGTWDGKKFVLHEDRKEK